MKKLELIYLSLLIHIILVINIYKFTINYTEGGWDEETNTFKDNIIKYPSESTDTNCIKQPYNNKTRRETLNLLNFVKKIENNELIKTIAGNIREVYLIN